MRALGSTILSLLLLHGPACTAGGDDGDTTAAETSGTGTSNGSSATTGGSATSSTETSGTDAGSSSATSEESGASGSPTATSDASSGGSDGTAASETGSGESCTPDASDGDCVACVKKPCCEAYLQCINDSICACTLDCVLMGGSFGSCSSQCGGQNDFYKTLYFCGQQWCLGTCDWPKPTGG